MSAAAPAVAGLLAGAAEAPSEPAIASATPAASMIKLRLMPIMSVSHIKRNKMFKKGTRCSIAGTRTR